MRRAFYNRVVDDDGQSCRSSFPLPFLGDGSGNPDYILCVDISEIWEEFPQVSLGEIISRVAARQISQAILHDFMERHAHDS